MDGEASRSNFTVGWIVRRKGHWVQTLALEMFYSVFVDYRRVNDDTATSLSTQLFLYSILSVRVSRKDKSSVMSYLFYLLTFAGLSHSAVSNTNMYALL